MLCYCYIMAYIVMYGIIIVTNILMTNDNRNNQANNNNSMNITNDALNYGPIITSVIGLFSSSGSSSSSPSSACSWKNEATSNFFAGLIDQIK
jgi:hypothetical protein